MTLKQSADALALRVLRKTEEYVGHSVYLWICPDGSAHVLLERQFNSQLASPPCTLVGAYRAPCREREILDDIIWFVGNG